MVPLEGDDSNKRKVPSDLPETKAPPKKKARNAEVEELQAQVRNLNRAAQFSEQIIEDLKAKHKPMWLWHLEKKRNERGDNGEDDVEDE